MKGLIPISNTISFSSIMSLLGGIFQDLAAKSTVFAPTIVVGVLSGILILLFFFFSSNPRKGRSHLPPLPVVPGLPIIGNLLQLKEKKPHKTFARWAETYGPIYSIRTGANTMVVLNSTEVAKEAMVTRFSSISTRKMSAALQILTSDKCMVAVSDYSEFHKNVKRYILTSVLGANAQKRFRGHRDTLVENVVEKLHSQVKSSPNEAVNFRVVFEDELFGLAFKEAVGEEIHSIHVEELGTTLSKKEIFKTLVTDFMEGAIAVDWRDFFPYLKWVPNKSFEEKIRQIAFRRNMVMKALIRKRKAYSQKEGNCYLDYLLSEATTLTEEQIATLVWEAIIEASDTTLVTTEWAMYELARAPSKQDRLYQEIRQVCGSESITEENLSQIPFLNAVFHETLRKHSPAPIVPPRHAHEDTQIGGYFIPKGSEIAINIYGCNMDKKQWENPEEWIPERFLDENYEASDMYKTMAFGAGKRVCAGSLQAMAISCVAIGRMVQEFEWTLSDGEEDNVDTMGLTTTKLHPLKAILKPRNGRR